MTRKKRRKFPSTTTENGEPENEVYLVPFVLFSPDFVDRTILNGLDDTRRTK